jgi:DNA-directed RNA polymerase specialized sigma24 family protein
MLKELFKYHKEWIAMVKSLGGGQYSEDVVQDMYIKIKDKNYLNNKKEINKFYVYLTLKSILLDKFRKESKINYEDINYHSEKLIYDNDINEKEAYNNFIDKVDNKIKDWYWYDRELFEIYRQSGKSIRKIAKESKISWVSIFNTLKNCKTEIKKELELEFLNYKKQL